LAELNLLCVCRTKTVQPHYIFTTFDKKKDCFQRSYRS